jgi:hypothetical protein
MKTRIICAFVLLFVFAFLEGDSPSVSAENQQKRIRFQVTTIGESANERTILAQTTIEGLPGTDFNINLETGNFKMKARFLSDLVTGDKLKIRARLDTRRFYGYSPINLPLYEEDSQNHTLEISFDESVVLLPFGRNGGAETLKIEITPILLSVVKTDEASRLTINFDKQIPTGEIAVEASKIPHKFNVEAVLLADGQMVAGGAADCLLEEEKEIVLLPTSNADSGISGQSFKTKLNINRFIRSRPQDLVDINFNFYRAMENSASKNQMIIPRGAGIISLTGELSYRLENMSLSDDKNYELKFKIRLGSGENEN